MIERHFAPAVRAGGTPFRARVWPCVARCVGSANGLRQNPRHARESPDNHPDARADGALSKATGVRGPGAAQPGFRGGDRGVPDARVRLPVLPDAAAVGVHGGVVLVQHRQRAPPRRTLGAPPRHEQHARLAQALAGLGVDGADPDRRQRHRVQRRRRAGRLAGRHGLARLLAGLVEPRRVAAGAVVDPRGRHHLLVLLARNHRRQRGRRADGAAPGRRTPAQAARIAAGATHAVQHAGEPAGVDRAGPSARPGHARPVDLVPARHARSVACRAAPAGGRVRAARRLPGADAGAHGRALADPARPAARAGRRAGATAAAATAGRERHQARAGAQGGGRPHRGECAARRGCRPVGAAGAGHRRGPVRRGDRRHTLRHGAGARAAGHAVRRQRFADAD